MLNAQKLEDANRWLDKAVKAEEEGKSKGMVDKMLDKACDLENEAFAS